MVEERTVKQPLSGIDLKSLTKWTCAVCVLVLVSLDGGTQAVNAQNRNDVWTPIGPLHGPAFFDIAVDPQTPSTLYAGSSHGIWKSTDGGGQWNAVNNGFTNPA